LITQPTLEDVRALSEWRPPLGVLSVYLGYDRADRNGAWRTELRNGLDAILESQGEAEHDRRLALRATAKRLAVRFEEGDLRPPPRAEVGFVEVSEKEGAEHWFGAGVELVAESCVELGQSPVMAPLLELCKRGTPRGVVLISAERVRLLGCVEGVLEELEDWELSMARLDPRGPGPDSPGLLGECGGLVANRAAADGFGEVIAFGSTSDFESFEADFNYPRAELVFGGDVDLITAPKGRVADVAKEVVARLEEERARALVGQAMAGPKGGRAAGRRETAEALAEGRVDHLVLDAAIDGGEAESLVRGALAGGARVTVVRGEAAASLAEAEGVAAILH